MGGGGVCKMTQNFLVLYLQERYLFIFKVNFLVDKDSNVERARNDFNMAFGCIV